jgi:anthranilate synthase component 1
VLRLASDGRLSGPHAAGAPGFLAALESWWEALRTPRPPSRGERALHGRLARVPGYEVAAEIEPRLALPPSEDSTAALAIRTPAAWIRDRRSGAAWLVAEPGYEALLDRFARDVRAWARGSRRSRPAVF